MSPSYLVVSSSVVAYVYMDQVLLITPVHVSPAEREREREREGGRGRGREGEREGGGEM